MVIENTGQPNDGKQGTDCLCMNIVRVVYYQYSLCLKTDGPVDSVK